MPEKLKVVWICGVSNQQIRDRLRYSKHYYKFVVPKLLRTPLPLQKDLAVWNTNAAREFESFKDIDLTIIFPQNGIVGPVQKFDINGIHYACFRSQEDSFFMYLKRKLTGKEEKEFKRNRKIIKNLINEIHPDLIHMIGAENPKYSIALLDCPKTVPTVTSLQTLMSAPDFFENYPISQKNYEYRAEIEKAVINRTDYIAQRAITIRQTIKKAINPNAVFLQMTLAIGVEINTEPSIKEYEFVYFANNVNKAADYAIEAFAFVCKKRSGIRLNISGNCPLDFRIQMDARIKELGIEGNVVFTGAQDTHEGVMNQVKRSFIAVLPLKVDLISSTIREAMAWGLPVVTTVTPATPKLNEHRESVLLSEIGDYQSMADNMLRLLEDLSFAEQIRNNAITTVRECYSNQANMIQWRKDYYEIIENYKNETPFTDDIILNN